MPNREVGISSVAELGEILRAVRKESGAREADRPNRKSVVSLQPFRYRHQDEIAR